MARNAVNHPLELAYGIQAIRGEEALQCFGCDAVDLQVIGPATPLAKPDGVAGVQAVGDQRFVQVVQRTFERCFQEQLPVEAVL